VPSVRPSSKSALLRKPPRRKLPQLPLLRKHLRLNPLPKPRLKQKNKE
jgi:hypothetical protein